MGAAEILLEHRQGEKIRRNLRVKANRDIFVIGSSKHADLRLTGDDVRGCHTVLRYKHPNWYVCDVSDVGFDNVERKLEKDEIVQIGKHQLRLVKHEREVKLFNEETTPNGQLALHQVVVFRNKKVVDTTVLQPGTPYVFYRGSEQVSLPAPIDSKWKVSEIGKCTIQQRLIPAQSLIGAEKITVERDIKKPFLAMLLLLGLLTLITAIWPKGETTVANLDEKSKEIIFNAKAIQKKRIEAKKLVGAKVKKGGTSQNNPNVSSRSNQPEESTAPKVSAKATQALTSLRNSGLNALIGKIAKRAAKSGTQISAHGVTPDTVGAGRAFFSNGTSTVGGGGSAAKVGSSYRLGGIGTKGVGGGASNYSDGTALAGGTVGMGDVAIAEEETIIDGGLDREVIAEVIRKNLGQIRYCYERQLSSNRELYGKIMAKWVIGADGLVMDPKIDNTTMKSSMVEGCVLRRIASWKFPLPKGGTQVKVTYPFLFKALD